MFVDVKRSTQFLMEYQKDFMFNTLGSDNGDNDADSEEEEEAQNDNDDDDDDDNM